MAKNQAYIAIGLEDLTQRPLKKIFGNLFKIEDTVKQVTGKFSIFGNSGKKDSKKVEKSIADLEQELRDLKSKRYFAKNIDDVRKLNLEIQDLENELQNLQGISDRKNIFSIDYAPHINALADSFQALSDSLDFVNDIEDIRQALTQVYDGTPEEIDNITRQVNRLQQQFGDDADEIIMSANAMTKQLGGTFEENLALIEQGYRKGANLNKNMLDQLREYPSALNGLKISNEQLLAVITQANKEGVWDDKMVDAIKEGYNQLANLTDDKKAVLQQLGFSPQDIEQAINQGAILDVFKQISESVGNLDATAQRSALGTLFSSLGEDAQGVILKFKDFNMSINDIDESLTDFQKRKLKFTGWMADMKSSISATASAWLPFIQFTSAGAGTITQLVPAFATIGDMFGKMKFNIGGLIKGFKGLVPSLLKAVKAQWLLNIAMDANPVGAIILGITAVITAIVLMVKHFDKITAWFKRQSKLVKVIIGIAVAFNPLLQVIIGISFAIRKLIDNWDKIKAKAVEIWHKIVAVFDGIVAVVNMLGKKILTFLQPVFDWINRQWTAVKEWTIRAWNNIVEWVKKAIENIKKFLINLKNKIIASFIAAKNAVISAFIWIKNTIKNFIDKLRTWLGPVVDVFLKPFYRIKDWITGLFDWIKDKFKWLIDLAKKLGVEISDTFTTAYDESLKKQEAQLQEQKQQKDEQNKDNTAIVFDNQTSNNYLASNGSANTGNNSTLISGSSDTAPKVFKITINFDQNFTINQKTDIDTLRNEINKSVVEAINDAEIMSA